MYTHVYVWGNNPKRAQLKGRACRIIAEGRLNSIMIEFENGQREVVSRYAVREKETMAFAKRNYKKATKSFPKGAAKKSGFAKKEDAAPEQERRPYGGGGNKSRGGGDSDFIGITGMFPTRKGGSYQVFLKPEHLEVLQNLEEGDSLGVTPGNTKAGDEIVRLWARKAA